MLILTDRISSLEVDLATWDGDAYITIKIDSRGFKGQNDLHVVGSEIRQFCSDLIQLHKTLKGHASLKSVSPDELNIEIQPYGSLGHMSVRGKCGYHVQTSKHLNWHSVEFGFEFEPQQLDSAVKVDWVRKFAK